jgi:hypothetical protein
LPEVEAVACENDAVEASNQRPVRTIPIRFVLLRRPPDVLELHIDPVRGIC